MNLKIIFNSSKGRTAVTATDGRVRLSDLKVGDLATIQEIAAPYEEDRHRMNVLGLSLGAEICVSRTAPGGDPAIYHVEGTDLALRREAAFQVIVSKSL